MSADPRLSRRILVVRVGALGDTLMATPVVRALRRLHPGAEIDFLCSQPAWDLLRAHPGLQQVFVLRRRHLPFFLSGEKRRLAARLRERQYDFAVLLEGAPAYRRLLERAGIGEIRSFQETPFLPHLHSVANNLRAAGVEDWEGEASDLELFLPAAGKDRGRALLRGLPRPRVALHPGFGPESKKGRSGSRLRAWPAERFAEVAQGLLGLGAGVVLTGSAQDRPLGELILADLPPRQSRNLAGKTSVAELGGLISGLDLFISVDTGPAHMAAALGIPLIVLWGPGKLQQTRPLSSRSPVLVLRHPVPCAPCQDTPLMKACRVNICMLFLTPQQVLLAARRLLSLPPKAG